jgi:hypothetical protein
MMQAAAAEKVLADLEGLGFAPNVLGPVGRLLRTGDPSDLELVHLVVYEQDPEGPLEMVFVDPRVAQHRADCEELLRRGRRVRSVHSLAALLAAGAGALWQAELAALRAPAPEIDSLPIFRLPLGDALAGIGRQMIREHRQREADPALRQRVDGGRRGRPRYRGSRLEADLFLVACGVGPKAVDPARRIEITDADRYELIAQTLSTLGMPTTAKAVKDRLAAARRYAMKHPGRPGPPVHPGVSMSERAEQTRRGIREQDSHRRRKRRR